MKKKDIYTESHLKKRQDQKSGCESVTNTLIQNISAGERGGWPGGPRGSGGWTRPHRSSRT